MKRVSERNIVYICWEMETNSAPTYDIVPGWHGRAAVLYNFVSRFFYVLRRCGGNEGWEENVLW
jgi:hypothetical protein